jgi:hypothetical protein
VPQHVRVRFNAEIGSGAARSTIREKPGAVNGTPRSDTNTKADFSTCRCRSVRSSRPVSGWVAGVPFLTQRVLKDRQGALFELILELDWVIVQRMSEATHRSGFNEIRDATVRQHAP